MKATTVAVCILCVTLFIHVNEVVSAPVNLDEVGDAYKATNNVRLLGYFYQGRYYGYYTTYSNLWKTPRWKFAKDEPPLSVKAAVFAAENYARGLFPEFAKLGLTKITLDNYLGGIWFYDIQFEIFARRASFMNPVVASTGPADSIEVLVLMDGTVGDREEEIDDPASKSFILKKK